METKNPSNNVIRLSDRRKRHDLKQPGAPRSGRSTSPRVIAVTSGKGGVGKTNIVANLGYAFTRLGKKVLILDADLGLGNLDVLLGLAPKYNLSHVLTGDKSISEIMVEGPGRLLILPAASGIQELTQLSKQQKVQILSELEEVIDRVDLLLIDTAAGISSNVMDFNVIAQEIIVVVSPEPTAITDAYALMKVLALKYAEKNCQVIVNLAGTARQGSEVFRQLNLVTERFLDMRIDYVGSVLFDVNVTNGIKQQKLVSDLYPDTCASKCFQDLARKIIAQTPAQKPKGDSHFFWHHLIENNIS
ncbi:MAG: MinD/ParA family protein [Desulfobacterales bacterium]|jgi:flagellar biosynthesis protein FlhG